jgi:hypothetical protein
MALILISLLNLPGFPGKKSKNCSIICQSSSAAGSKFFEGLKRAIAYFPLSLSNSNFGSSWTGKLPGSSGSPVFNDDWEVVALHHAGGHLKTNDKGDIRFINQAVTMKYLMKIATKTPRHQV